MSHHHLSTYKSLLEMDCWSMPLKVLTPVFAGLRSWWHHTTGSGTTLWELMFIMLWLQVRAPSLVCVWHLANDSTMIFPWRKSTELNPGRVSFLLTGTLSALNCPVYECIWGPRMSVVTLPTSSKSRKSSDRGLVLVSFQLLLQNAWGNQLTKREGPPPLLSLLFTFVFHLQ